MSWSRWSGDSDVYVFEHVEGGVECCGCPLGVATGERIWPASRRFYTVAALHEHFEEHKAAGHTLPEYLFDAFKDWIDESPERVREAKEIGLVW